MRGSERAASRQLGRLARSFESVRIERHGPDAGGSSTAAEHHVAGGRYEERESVLSAAAGSPFAFPRGPRPTYPDLARRGPPSVSEVVRHNAGSWKSTSPSRRPTIGCSSPPSCGTSSKPLPPALLDKTILPSPRQTPSAPPPVVGTLANGIGSPPLTATFQSFSSDMNPTKALSGDQKNAYGRQLAASCASPIDPAPGSTKCRRPRRRFRAVGEITGRVLCPTTASEPAHGIADGANGGSA